MRYAEMILPEFDQEMAGTRKVLERVPDDKLQWRPHAKSNTIGWNANHLAELPEWVPGILTETSYDTAGYQPPKLASRQVILDLFDRNVTTARQAIRAVNDDELGTSWSLIHQGQPIFTMPRFLVMRNFVLNHVVHHRAVLCVYLRLNDVPVPGLYGPSGDEH